jgi:hypothetical protein
MMMAGQQPGQNQAQGQGQGQQPQGQQPQGPAQQPAQQQGGWRPLIEGYIFFLIFTVSKYWDSIQYFMYSRISQKYADFLALIFVLLIVSPVFFYRKRLNKYIRQGLYVSFFASLIAAFFTGASVKHVERELVNQAVGNDFRELAVSAVNETHRIYGFMGRSGTGKTKTAEKLAEVDFSLLKRHNNARVFLLHNQVSKSVDDFFDPSNADSLGGWIRHGCVLPKCYVILDDLHLLLDYYYLNQQPEQVELFFDKIQEFVDENPRAVVIFIIEITAFSRSVGQSRIAQVSSSKELQKELAQSNSVFGRLGNEYLSVYFKDVHRDYDQWRAAMQVHLDELVHNTILLSQAQVAPFNVDTKIEFDESVFKECRKLVYAFKDVKKFILPRLYWKIIDAATPRDCTPANGHILNVYANDDFNVKCEPCGFMCRLKHSDAWSNIRERLSLVPVEYFFRGMDVTRVFLN